LIEDIAARDLRLAAPPLEPIAEMGIGDEVGDKSRRELV
jgi:hypothetical protein